MVGGLLSSLRKHTTKVFTPYSSPRVLLRPFSLAIIPRSAISRWSSWVNVDGKQLFHEYPQAAPAKVLEEISEALKSLRENGLVFSDLGSPNILVTDQHHAQLVDFGWCGKVGEGKYPANIENVKWPEEVVLCGFLELEHDNEMFRRLSWRE